MQCYVCGTVYEDELPNCPVCGTMTQREESLCYNGMPPLEVEVRPQNPQIQSPKRRPKPHIALRIGMQLISFVLCLIFSVSLVATVVIADIHMLTSANGIKQMITSALLPARAPYVATHAVGGANIRLNDSNILTDNDKNPLIDMLYDTMQEVMGKDTPIDREELVDFIENSTVSDFIAEKTAGYAEDILSGTNNTQITADELVGLVEENQRALEDAFGVKFTKDQMDQIRKNVTDVVEKYDLNNKVRSEIDKMIDEATSGAAGAGIPLAEILQVFNLLTQDATLYAAIAFCVLLMALLCGANFYNVPAGMTWAAVPCILVGLILAAPIAVMQMMPEMLGGLASFAGMVAVFAPIHYAVPIFGVVLLIASIVWRIVRSCIRNGQ